MANADFERLTDFLSRMIEKYGAEIDLPNEGNGEETKDETTLTELKKAC